MNIEIDRKVICTVEQSYSSNSMSDTGRLRVFYEVLPSKEIILINSGKPFCKTEQVFVTGQFTELKEKFGDKLFKVICKPSDYGLKEGDCNYVTRISECSDIKGFTCCQILDQPLPNVLKPDLLTDEKPLTRTILLRDNNYLRGPFDYTCSKVDESQVYKLQLKAIKAPLNKIPSYHIGEINSLEYKEYLYEKTNLPIFLSSIKVCFKDAKSIDFISDDDIISVYGSMIVKNSEIRSFNKGTINLIKKSFVSNIQYKKLPDHFNRFFEILEVANGWEDTRKQLMENVLVTSSGKRVLEKYIETNKKMFFEDEKQAYIEKLKLDHNDEKAEIKKLLIQKETINSNIRKAQSDFKKKILEYESPESFKILSDQRKKDLDTDIAEKKAELNCLITKCNDLKKKYSDFTTIDELNSEIEYLNRDKKKVENQLTAREGEVDIITSKLKESNEALTAKLLKLKPDIDALLSIAPKAQTELVSYNVEIKRFDSNITKDDFREEMINDVHKELNSFGRKIDYNTVTNILTTIAQSQFTLFSGRPGTGKTSLAKMIGKSLGLKSRLLNIPVARGWTSSRDVLGFYNTLSCSFNSAATGLYELLSQLNEEVQNNLDSAPAICLFDEFNLSQPEHYLSPFLEMADPESERSIITGDPDSPCLKIPRYLRFLGTINNDESVQALTPRMLDRSTIINFDDDDMEPDYDFSLNSIKSLDDLNIKPISGSEFINLFTPASLELPEAIGRTLNLIIDTLREDKPEYGATINISYRKKRAIHSYHNVTYSMYIDSDNSDFTALDFAVSQHIIPLINGHGHTFGKRLDQLRGIIPSEMERTHKMLKRIIDVGDQNMSTYNFHI